MSDSASIAELLLGVLAPMPDDPLKALATEKVLALSRGELTSEEFVSWFHGKTMEAIKETEELLRRAKTGPAPTSEEAWARKVATAHFNPGLIPSPACEIDGGECSVALTEWCEINVPPFRQFNTYPKRGEWAFMVTAEGDDYSVVPIRSTRVGWICGPFHDYRFVSSPELASALGWLTEEELRLFLPVYAPKEGGL